LDGLPFSLQGVALFSGLYLNELLVRLLPKEEENQALFLVYEKALQHLASGQFAPALRRFEKQLLQTLGYGLSFSQDAMGDPIQPEGFYYLVLEQGFLPTTEQAGQDYRLLGRHLLAIAADDYQDLAVQQVAKTIMRRLINAQLTQPLKSREYLQKMLA
jgi:DNA repair protein RecO (recombination protein O)